MVPYPSFSCSIRITQACRKAALAITYASIEASIQTCTYIHTSIHICTPICRIARSVMITFFIVSTANVCVTVIVIPIIVVTVIVIVMIIVNVNC